MSVGWAGGEKSDSFIPSVDSKDVDIVANLGRVRGDEHYLFTLFTVCFMFQYHLSR